MEESVLDLEAGWRGANAGQAAGKRKMTSLTALTAGDTSTIGCIFVAICLSTDLIKRQWRDVRLALASWTVLHSDVLTSLQMTF